MYTLRNIARRGTMLAGAGALAFASLASGSSAFADALNPLTHRSLTLSSSSPGWDYLDGSGNATYAPPNSGANGQKGGNTFSFNVSTDSSGGGAKALNAFTFQYCINPAGDCTAPGDNGWTGTAGSMSRNGDSTTNKTSDLNIVADPTNAPREMTSAEYTGHFTSGNVSSIPAPDDSQGNFVVMTEHGGTWSYSPNWAMKTENKEDGTVPNGTATGRNNFIVLYNTSAPGATPAAGDAVKIIFFGTNDNYITNPGSGEFFVKINDYNAVTGSGATTEPDPTTLIDGGVTVANVMNQSIQITTKVLETMDFSVGTIDPYTLSDAQLSTATANARTAHGQCDPILKAMAPSDTPNILALGSTTNESSLSTNHTYSTHSFWRLSSNSSAGATIYYSGVTLENTVGNSITAIGTTAHVPAPGSPQFGLALDNGTRAANMTGQTVTGPFSVDYNTETTAGKVYENGADVSANTPQGIDASVATDITAAGYADYHAPQLAPLAPEPNYDGGTGAVNPADYTGGTTASFAFDNSSNTIPTPLATESDQVVDCATGKVRYIANIAATTPAGIYTTKINYIAAPQY